MEWFKWWHGTVTDPKFKRIAKIANTSVANVLAVWSCLLEHASKSPERGSVEDFNCEDIDILLDVEDGTTLSIFNAMIERELIKDNIITQWNKRQPTDVTVNERVRRYREKQKAKCNDTVTVCNVTVTECNGDVTQDKDKDKDKDNIHTPPKKGGGIAYTPAFNQLWDYYRNNTYEMPAGEKKKAFISYNKLISLGCSHEVITNHIKSYLQECQNNKIKTKHMVTFLNQHDFSEEINPANQFKRSGWLPGERLTREQYQMLTVDEKEDYFRFLEVEQISQARR